MIIHASNSIVANLTKEFFEVLDEQLGFIKKMPEIKHSDVFVITSDKDKVKKDAIKFLKGTQFFANRIQYLEMKNAVLVMMFIGFPSGFLKQSGISERSKHKGENLPPLDYRALVSLWIKLQEESKRMENILAIIIKVEGVKKAGSVYLPMNLMFDRAIEFLFDQEIFDRSKYSKERLVTDCVSALLRKDKTLQIL